MRYPACILASLLVCCADDRPATPTNDGPPVSSADLKGLFERLDSVSAVGYRCDHRFTRTRQYLVERRLEVEPMIRWLGEHGAGCDCEVMFNVEQQWGRKVGFEPK